MTPQIVKIIGLAVVAALLFFSGIFTGYSYCKRAQDAGVIKQAKKDAKAVDKHQGKKEKVEKNVTKQIDTIKKIIDPSGCLDAPAPGDYLNRLFSADRAAESGFN